MTALPPTRVALALVLVAACGFIRPATPFAQTSAAPAATAAPALDVAAQLEFLSTARVVATRPIGKGITGARRVTLTDGTVTHDAAFQSVDQVSIGRETPRNLRRAGELRFVDHYRYNIAAWRLAQQLGLDYMMPATVERAIDRPGALSWWVDDVLMDEDERQKSRTEPPGGALELARQFARMALFTELVRDTDRNKGNVVFTRNWRLVMLDFTRAFRLTKNLTTTAELNSCDRNLLVRLRAVTEPELAKALKPYLSGEEVAALMARRDLLVAHFDRLIAQRGEAAVLY